MLSQVNHWVDYVATGVDALLLLRILMLKLHRTYLFITLVCVLGVLFDAVTLWLGDTPEAARVFFYTRFLMAIVYPIAVWDVFEEISDQLGTLRRAAIFRTITSLLLICVFGLIFSGIIESTDENSSGPAFVNILAVIVWTGSATGSLTFLWVIHRHLRTQTWRPPHNTFVWLIFFELFLGGEVASSFFVLLHELLSADAREIMALVLGVYGVLITAWCILKLRGTPSNVPSDPVKASPSS